MDVRTDLAMEERELCLEEETDLPAGIACEEETRGCVQLTRVEITSEEGAAMLRKPKGTYITMEMPRESVQTQNEACAAVLAEMLGGMIGDAGSVLVVGLGNAAITPDALGPMTVSHVLATRHLRSALPELFSSFRQVSTVAPGVLGTTGMESVEIVRGIVQQIEPELVIAIDALAARSPQRLCRSVQLADSGIVPGSGIRNDRAALNQSTLGIPVLSLGIPTVCDLHDESCDVRGMIVTPGDIDLQVGDLSRMTARGLNRALHPDVDPDDLADFVS